MAVWNSELRGSLRPPWLWWVMTLTSPGAFSSWKFWLKTRKLAVIIIIIIIKYLHFNLNMMFISGTADLVYTLSCISQLEIMKQHINVWFSPYSVCFWYLTSSSLWHYSRLSKIYRVNQGLCYFVRKSSVAIALYGFYDLWIYFL